MRNAEERFWMLDEEVDWVDWVGWVEKQVA